MDASMGYMQVVQASMEAPVEVRELLPRKLYDYFFYESGSKVPKK